MTTTTHPNLFATVSEVPYDEAKRVAAAEAYEAAQKEATDARSQYLEDKAALSALVRGLKSARGSGVEDWRRLTDAVNLYEDYVRTTLTGTANRAQRTLENSADSLDLLGALEVALREYVQELPGTSLYFAPSRPSGKPGDGARNVVAIQSGGIARRDDGSVQGLVTLHDWSPSYAAPIWPVGSEIHFSKLERFLLHRGITAQVSGGSTSLDIDVRRAAVISSTTGLPMVDKPDAQAFASTITSAVRNRMPTAPNPYGIQVPILHVQNVAADAAIKGGKVKDGIATVKATARVVLFPNPSLSLKSGEAPHALSELSQAGYLNGNVVAIGKIVDSVGKATYNRSEGTWNLALEITAESSPLADS